MSGAPGAPAHSTARVLRNTAALALGRNLIALCRLGMLAIVARGLGTDTFGQYALLIALLMVAEGLLDFGSNEVFVREVLSQPQRRTALLRVLAAGRLLHAPVAWALLVGAALVLGYPGQIVQAAAVAGLSLVFLGGVMVFRVVFRTELTMEREVVAEFVSVLVMIALLLAVARRGGGIVDVMLCHAASRAVFFVLAAWLARQHFRFSLAGVGRAELAWSWRTCLPVGMAGALVMLYDPMDVLVLSRLGSFEDTARFGAAQRLAWPLLITLSAVSGTLYSVVAASWPHDRARLQRACQRAFDAVVVGGLAVVCGAIAGAEALLGLISHELTGGAAAFSILVVLCVVKAISGTLGPVLLVVGAQKVALGIVAGALAVKLVASLLVVPVYGVNGLALTALAVEACCVAVPAVWVVSRRAGIQLRFGAALRALLLCAGLAWLARQAVGQVHGLLLAVGAGLAYLGLALATGTLQLDVLKGLKAPEAAAP